MHDQNPTFPAIQDKLRNNSTLSYADCMLRLADPGRPFEDMTNDDLDSIYACATGRWAYHMSRDGYIHFLKEKRAAIIETGI